MNNLDLINKIRDPKIYLESFCKIKTKKGGLDKFILKEAQKDLFNDIGRHNRIIILKARQIGFSTAICGYAYHFAITHPGVNVALIGYNTDLTMEFLEKVKLFWSTSPEEIRPTIQYNSKYEMTFPKLNSKIIILPSTENVGRGYTLHFVLMSEFAMWDKAEEKITTIEASVPENGIIIIESTPYGIGNAYHRRWVTDNNGYLKKEYGWWWEYTQEQIDSIEKRMNNRQKFDQEYNLTFLTTGRPVFDPNLVKDQRKNILNIGDKNGDDIVKEEDGIIFYSQPNKEKLYVLGVDSSEGVIGGDFSVLHCWDRMSGEEIFNFRNILPPDRLAILADKWGRIYNNALMVPEVNNHGIVVVNKLKELMYPNFYYRPAKYETAGGMFSDKIGWRTSVATRPIVIDDFAKAIRDKELTIHSKILLDEMSVFVYDNNNREAPIDSTYHDDTIFAAAVGLQGFKVLYDKELNQLDEQESNHLSWNN